MCSTPSESKAVELVKGLTETCSKGGFHLTKWVSNKREVLECIPEEEWGKNLKSSRIDVENTPVERALGMMWSIEDDEFGYKIKMKERPPTRRGILSTVNSVFDPLGCVSPVVLTAKQLLQATCRMQLGWDEKIPTELGRKWQNWQLELPRLAEFKMMRCLKPAGFEEPKSVTLHHFADASELGYGTISYLRLENDKREVKCSFLMSKSRVAPLKQVTIPRMELTAATVAVRVDHMIKRELEIEVDSTYFWTDSMSVLWYINSATTRFKTFIANRLAVIHDGSSPKQWRHIESALNPADICSSGRKVEQFLQLEDWKNGPEFLHKSEDEWPKTPEFGAIAVPEDPEVKKAILACAVKPSETKELMLDRVIEHYSDWMRLRKAVCCLLRFVRWLKTKRETRKSQQSLLGALTLQEVQAERKILQYVQSQVYADEIRALAQNKRGRKQ